MASETGHAKNVANFEILISGVQSYGAGYNPPRTNLKLPALTALVADALDAIQEVNHFISERTAAAKERENPFEEMKDIVPRVVAAVDISDAGAIIGDRARTLARKLRGDRAGERIEDDPATPDVDESAQNNSVSQMSYDNQLANFEALVSLLETQETTYTPNEVDLQADSLHDRANQLRAKNAAVTAAQTSLDVARNRRDNVLYQEGTGLFDIAADIKTYVKSVFGAASLEYAQIKDLKFTKPR